MRQPTLVSSITGATSSRLPRFNARQSYSACWVPSSTRPPIKQESRKKISGTITARDLPLRLLLTWHSLRSAFSSRVRTTLTSHLTAGLLASSSLFGSSARRSITIAH